ncbi:glycoside hydrolase family 31 protein [Thermolongibacillus altinsuensis]
MLEDTSFAIRPLEKNEEQEGFQSFGNVQNGTERKQYFSFTCERGSGKICFYRDDVVRIVLNPFGEASMSSSPAVVKTPEKVEMHVEETEKEWVLETKKLKVIVHRAPFLVSIYDQQGNALVRDAKPALFDHKGKIACFHEMTEVDHIYGLGEKTGFLNKRGGKWTMWNTDVYAPHNPETDPLYQAHPYFMVLRNGRAHGVFFDNTFKTTFDFRSNSVYSFAADGGQLDYYVFAGPHPKDVLEQYTDLTGRMPLPPKWAIGYHQSRYSYETEQEVRELANTFIEKGIPLDAIYLDIHYMDEYRVFTFDRRRFPNPKEMIGELKEAGIRVVPIVDPGVKVDAEYAIYREGVERQYFCKYIEGNVYFGEVWPGKSSFPDFINKKVRKWWGEKHSFYTDLGIEGIWNDMNEPSVFNETKTMDEQVVHDDDGKLKTHRELHNIYGLMMCEATYKGMKKLLNGKRPFLLTRSGFSGIQRYAAVWTGDNRSFWEHLELSLPMCMNLGLSGVAFCGADVGGFAHDSNGELLARWTQVGAFIPYFRNHCAIGFARQEPWAFGEQYEPIIKQYIELRYQWLPHLYSLFAEAHQTGTPVMRPLLMEYPNDERTWNISDQFMIGHNVIIAPILRPNTTHRVVYLPKGTWVDYWSGEVLEGEKYHLIEAPLEKLPIYIKQGSMIVLGEPKRSTAIPDERLTLHVYKLNEGEATYTIYDDDGLTFAYEKGEYVRQHVHAIFKADEIHLQMETEGTYRPTWKLHVAVWGANEQTKVMINGKQASFDEKTNTFIISS